MRKCASSVVVWSILLTSSRFSYAAQPPDDSKRAAQLQAQGAFLIKQCQQKTASASQVANQAGHPKDADALQQIVTNVQSLIRDIDNCGQQLEGLAERLQQTGKLLDWASNMRKSSVDLGKSAQSYRQWCASQQQRIQALRSNNKRNGEFGDRGDKNKHDRDASPKPSTGTTTTAGNAATPAVTITSPASGSNVSGTVTLTAKTTGKVNVAYTLDGSGYLDPVLTASPYSFAWDTTQVANGTHKLTAGAWDATSRQYAAGSATVLVTVNNAKPAAPAPSTGTAAGAGAPASPLVLISPKGGETWTAGSARQILWKGGNPSWPMTIQLVNGTGTQVLESIAGSAANNGAYGWTLNVPAGKYVMYVQGDRGKSDSQWVYGQPFTVQSSAAPAPQPSTWTTTGAFHP